jgi:hypothetical protein
MLMYKLYNNLQKNNFHLNGINDNI